MLGKGNKTIPIYNQHINLMDQKKKKKNLRDSTQNPPELIGEFSKMAIYKLNSTKISSFYK